MIRLLYISDFSESFALKLLKGIVQYSRQGEQWEICRMPPSFIKAKGFSYVADWAKSWGANAVIGAFEFEEDIEIFQQKGILVVAQDYKKLFKIAPNITGDYFEAGRMAANFFMERGYTHYGFFGFKDVYWSDERMNGFRSTLEKAGKAGSFHEYRSQNIERLWFYERNNLTEWLQSLPKPIAILACDDNQATNLIDACHVAGIRIPSDISIIGVDNDEIVCNINTPLLSSVSVDIEKGGYQTAALIEKLVKNPGAPMEDIVLKAVKVVERLSSATFATTDPEIQKALKFIHQNIQSKMNVKDIMGQVALSRRLLERRFKEVTGSTIYQYVSTLKVRKFAELLMESNEQVINIAINLGENDTKNLVRRFKAEYGMTPTEWRARYAAKAAD